MDAATDFSAGSGLRPSLLADYSTVRAFSETLAEPLSPEDMTVQSMADASPTKWHLAHTSWFFETFILKAQNAAYRPFDPAYEYLFNSYYNGIGPQYSRPDRGVLSRPTVMEIRAYRAHVDAAMRALLEDCSDRTLAAIKPLIELGLNHEQQHQELILTDLKHAMSLNPLHPAVYARSGQPGGEAGDAEWIAFDGGLKEIGWTGNGFAFDNEGPVHQVFLRPFRLASRPVTNAEYLAFVTDGGYRNARIWLSDGWAAIRREGWTQPIYWKEIDGAWFEYTLAGLRPLDLAAPVCHISFFEANAYAEWAGARLPSEFEWEAAARGVPVHGHFADSGAFHPRAATSEAGQDKGLHQIFGDVWEWTQSAYAPYPGFKADADVVGEYNGKFMVSQLVLRGGSCATPAGHIRSTYRNFFYPHHRWQFSGLRLAEDA
jgi:ergothioneine biosynthesis protein EgtB